MLDRLSPRRVLADRAEDTCAVREFIAAMGAEAVIPCNPTRTKAIPFDFETYKIQKNPVTSA